MVHTALKRKGHSVKKQKQEKGFALISSLLFTFMAFGMSLSYFNNVVSEKRQVVYSQNVQKAEAIAEAGMEEAMWEYNYGGADFDGWQAGVNSWTKTSQGYDPDGEYTVTVDVTTPTNPVITSTGTYEGSGGDKQAQIKCGATAAGGSSPWTKPIKTIDGIDLSGNATVDTYNSLNGAYNASTNLTLAGDVQTNSTGDPAIQLTGNAKVYGEAATGTGGVVETNGNATVGSTAGGINETYSDVTVPDALSSAATSASLIVNGNQSGSMNVNGTVNYKCAKLDVSGNATYTFTGSGTVNLYLDSPTSANSVRITGNGKVVVGAGVTLVIYGTEAMHFNGNGVVNNNGSQSPQSLQIYGTPTCDTIAVSGNGDVVGLVYAPQALVRVNGNGGVYGAVIANEYIGSGNGKVHYDSNLANIDLPLPWDDDGPGGPPGPGGNSAQINWYTRTT